MEVPIQDNSTDCGLYLLHNFEVVMANNTVPLSRNRKVCLFAAIFVKKELKRLYRYDIGFVKAKRERIKTMIDAWNLDRVTEASKIDQVHVPTAIKSDEDDTVEIVANLPPTQVPIDEDSFEAFEAIDEEIQTQKKLEAAQLANQEADHKENEDLKLATRLSLDIIESERTGFPAHVEHNLCDALEKRDADFFLDVMHAETASFPAKQSPVISNHSKCMNATMQNMFDFGNVCSPNKMNPVLAYDPESVSTFSRANKMDTEMVIASSYVDEAIITGDEDPRGLALSSHTVKRIGEEVMASNSNELLSNFAERLDHFKSQLFPIDFDADDSQAIHSSSASIFNPMTSQMQLQTPSFSH